MTSKLLDRPELSAVRGPTVRHRPVGVHSNVGADEARRFLESVGIWLDPWQLAEVTDSIAEAQDGSWASFEVCEIVPRQNGKGDVLEARELLGLFLLGERLIIHTAHEFKTANEAFLRLVAKIEACPALKAEVKSIRYANGEQGVELLDGARIKYAARTGGAGRGFAGADLVVYDEAYSLTAEQVAASLPTLSTSRNPQVWYASSAGKGDSTLLWSLRKRALRAAATGECGDRLQYSEWTAERVSWNVEKGRVESRPLTEAQVSDRQLWASANPTAGERISWQYLEAEFASMPADQFCRERLGVFDPEPADEAAAKLPAGEWAATRCSLDEARVAADRRPLVVWFDVDLDGRSGSVGVATGTLNDAYVELVKFGPGVGWLAGDVVTLVGRVSPSVVVFNAAGPALAQAEAVRVELARLGQNVDVRGLTTSEYRAACEGFLAEVVEGRLSRPEGQPQFDMAGEKAGERRLGEGWAWDRREATVPISPLVGATCGRFLLPLAVDQQVDVAASVW